MFFRTPTLRWRASWLCLVALIPFVTSVQAAPPVEQTERVYLSGTDKDHTVPWDFRVSAGRRAGAWLTVPVPGCWEMHGFGTYRYGSWGPEDEYGEYRRNFDVPASWLGRRVFLVYEGAMTETETWVNGLPAGAGPTSHATPAPTPIPTLRPREDDRAFDNSSAGGVARTGDKPHQLGRHAAFTLSAWVRPAGTVTTGFPRLILIGANPGYDAARGQGAYLSIYNQESSAVRAALQFKVNGDTGSGALSASDLIQGTDWIFVAVTYDSSRTSGQVNFYVADRASPLTAARQTVTYAGGAVDFGSAAHAYFLNRTDLTRTFAGWGDDFRLHDGALGVAELEQLRRASLGLPVSALPAALLHWNFDASPPPAAEAVVAANRPVFNVAGGKAAALPVAGGVSCRLPGVVTNLHRGGFYEFSHEITDQLAFGASNLLEVTVRKVSGDAALNTAERKGDYWNFGGLFRPVYLESRPAEHITRIAVNARHDGQITVDVFPSGLVQPAVAVARVSTLAGVPVGGEFTVALPAGAATARLVSTLPGILPWSHEFPQRYRLHVELRDSVSKTTLHSFEEIIGFRTVSFVKGEGFYLNGARVRLVGTSHHEFWPTTGRTSSRAQHAADLELMKAMNMNLVRRAHYPASREFYEEADRIGMLVFDELGGWQNAYGNEAAPRLVKELVTRDVNHPSVIAWDNGNEGGWNTSVDDDFALYDPQARSVLHPANWNHEKSGLNTHHYSGYALVTKQYLGAGKAAFMSTENLHALYDGGGGAGLQDYWDAIRLAPNGAGLLIWAFIDEALMRDDHDGKIDFVGDAAPDGLVGPYREKEASFNTVRAIWNPVQITAPRLAAGDPTLEIENRFVFTDVSGCSFRWQLGRFPHPGADDETLDAGWVAGPASEPFAGPAIAPGASGVLKLALPSGWQAHDALRLTVSDPHGRELQTWTCPLRTEAEIRARVVARGAARPLFGRAISATEQGAEIVVKTGTRVFRFDTGDGRLLGVAVEGQSIALANGPRPLVGKWTVASVKHGRDGSDYVISVNDLATSPNAFRWRVHPDGWLGLEYRYTLTGEQAWLGVTFDYPEDNVTGLTWLGAGPERVWKNRLVGPSLGVYRKAANNTDTGKAWVYPEFRGYHAGLRWATFATTEAPITVATATPDLFLRVLSWPDASTSRLGVNVACPPGDISLLHGINAIGHKFGDAASLGPQGLPNQAQGVYTASVDFFFGVLPPPARSATPRR